MLGSIVRSLPIFLCGFDIDSANYIYFPVRKIIDVMRVVLGREALSS